MLSFYLCNILMMMMMMMNNQFARLHMSTHSPDVRIQLFPVHFVRKLNLEVDQQTKIHAGCATMSPIGLQTSMQTVNIFFFKSTTLRNLVTQCHSKSLSPKSVFSQMYFRRSNLKHYKSQVTSLECQLLYTPENLHGYTK